MRKQCKWSLFGIAAIGLVAVVWPDSIPLIVTADGGEPGGIVDEAGDEMHLWSLSVTNFDSVRIMMEKHPAVEFRVGEDWVATDQMLDFGRIEPNRGSTEILLVPANATACRVRLTYQTENWKARLLQLLGKYGRRQLARMPWLAKHLWTDQGNTFSDPPRWREARVLVDAPSLPQTNNHR